MNKKYKFICHNCKNVTIASGSSIQQKNKCSHCSGNKRISEDRFNDYIRREAINLTTEFLGMSCKHTFQCLACNHSWETAAANIWAGKGCPNCAINNKKLSIQDLRKLAESKKLLLLSEKCLGIRIIHTWQCIKCNKILKIKPCNVRRGTACRKCKKDAVYN